MPEEQTPDETTEDQAAEPVEVQEAQTPAKKLSMAQRMDRIEELLVKTGLIDAGSLGR